MDAFLRNAEQILETAWEAKDSGASEYLISLSYRGGMQMLTDTMGWSLPALAAEHGALAVYRVSRPGKQIRVEGWAPSRTCVLNRDLPANRPRYHAPADYATLLCIEAGSGSANDRSPQVWNS